MSLGFEQAGFDVVAAVDSDPIHVETYSENFPRCRTLCSDMPQLSGEDIRACAGLGQRQIHVVFGGPPCQGFSVGGKRRSGDPRNLLLYDFARLLRELRPLYFVVENVRGLLLAENETILQSFLEQIEAAGYGVVEPIQDLDAADFGVPQRRRRVFILGYLKGLPEIEYPTPLFSRDGNGTGCPPQVWDAIGDLPDVDKSEELLESDVYYGQLGFAAGYARALRGEVRDLSDYSKVRRADGRGLTGCMRTTHGPETVRRFAATAPGSCEPVSRFQRLSKVGLARALRAGTGPSHGSFTAPRPIHPVRPRCITVREGARLHSFPDWFRFHPTKWHGFRQLGNSVPPLLARAVARQVRSALRAGDGG